MTDIRTEETQNWSDDPGLEILVDMAREGELDPWDVDLVDVTDRYLDACREAPLAPSGSVIFYASVLLRLKAELLAARTRDESAEPDFPFPEEEGGDWLIEDDWTEWEEPFNDANDEEEKPSYETFDDGLPSILTQPARRRPRPGALTLGQLLDALQEARRRSDERERERREARREEPTEPPANDAHADDIEAAVAHIRERLRSIFPARSDRPVAFSSLNTNLSRSGSFCALLFLANEEEIDLRQEELYTELYIHQGEPSR